MVSNVGEEPWTAEDLLGFGKLLDRDQVIGSPLAEQTFTIVDDIWLTDPYVQDFVASASSEVS